jgi:hypothetical protein
MLNEQPRKVLEMIVARYGVSICEEPKRFEKMLRDLCPEHKLEVGLLLIALKENVVEDLLHPPQNVSTELILKSLSYRLQKNCGTAAYFADWAIKSWMKALQAFLPQETSPVSSFNSTEIITPSTPPSTLPSLKIGLTTPPQKVGKFIIQDGIAQDTQTGLSWLRFGYGQTWQNNAPVGQIKLVTWHLITDAITHFNHQGGYAGFKDWRLPATDELKSLINKVQGKSGYCIDKTVFPSEMLEVWSFLPGLHGHRDAWVVNFSNGQDNYAGIYNGYAIRLVRGKNTQLEF